MRSVILSAVMGVGLMTSVSAFAAIEISAETLHPEENRTSPMTMDVTPDAMKIDMDKFMMLYRADTGTITNVMKDKHEYMSIDPDTMQKMNAMMATMQARMKQQMASMPEAQRKQMEASMGAKMMGGGSDGPPPVYQKTGKTKTVGSWSCEVFHKTISAEMSIDSCIAHLSAIGLTHDDLAVFQNLSAKIQQSMPSMSKAGGMGMDMAAQTEQIGFEGFPVESVTMTNGKVTAVSSVKTIQHLPLPAGTFDIPAGYTKMAMPAMPQ